MSYCACKIFNTIQVYMIWCIFKNSQLIRFIWCIPFIFAINAVVDEMIVYFYYACKRKFLSSAWFTLFARKFRGMTYLCIIVLEISIQNIIWIHTIVCLYSMLVSNDERNKCILNHVLWSIWNDCHSFIWACVTNHVPLFEHAITIEVSWLW